MSRKTNIAFPNQMKYIIAPSRRAGRGLGVGFLYLTQPITAIPNVQYPMPDTQCPMPNAQCPMPNAQCPMPNAQ
ncbi:hypothetical protein [Nostoc sp.]|uniref:hypothetical protein n=1 Tax=Nostoc sp. TaxID=1180 RepID=UPI002FFD237F